MGINQLEYKIDNTSFNGMHSIKEQLVVVYFFSGEIFRKHGNNTTQKEVIHCENQ